MLKKDFFYDLPPKLIAQKPVEPRNHSRLMHFSRKDGKLNHDKFYNLKNYLLPGDCLIINDTRVIPARLTGIREDTGSEVEFLLLNQKNAETWEALTGPGKKAKPGHRFIFGDTNNPAMSAEILDVIDGGNRLVKFVFEGVFFELLDKLGQMPLPHYITEALRDKERYQTVYSKYEGSAAAPTAGLHFTPEMLSELEDYGVKIGKVTLHVGLGTFRPVKEEVVENHKMHSEFYNIPESTAKLINRTKKAGGRVIAVGTTSCRTLESATLNGHTASGSGNTDIFITPGYNFRCIDGLVTNFHLPESTLIMLVSAFAGYENTMNAYKTAVEENYRFFSFGDAMIIV